MPKRRNAIRVAAEKPRSVRFKNTLSVKEVGIADFFFLFHMKQSSWHLLVVSCETFIVYRDYMFHMKQFVTWNVYMFHMKHCVSFHSIYQVTIYFCISFAIIMLLAGNVSCETKGRGIMIVECISVGTEILLGDILNTNVQ